MAGRDGKDAATRPASAALLSYQTRLLESPSLSRTSSLSRSNSQSGGILAPNGVRRWTQSHRSTTSTDLTRDGFKRSSVEVTEPKPAPSESITSSSNEPAVFRSIASSSSFPREIDSNRDFATSRTPRDTGLAAELREKSNQSEPEKPPLTDAPRARAAFQRSPLPQLYSEPQSTSATASSPSPLSKPVFTPRHNSSASVDSVRGRWEERAREADLSRDAPPTSPKKLASYNAIEDRRLRSSPERQATLRPLPTLPSPTKPEVEPVTPVALKRRTMPATMTAGSIREQWELKSRSDEVAQSQRSPERSPERKPLNDLSSSPVHKRRTIPSFEDPTTSPTRSSPNLATSDSPSTSSPRQLHFPSSTSLKSSAVPDVQALGDFAIFSPASTLSRKDSTRDVFGSTRGSRANSFDAQSPLPPMKTTSESTPRQDPEPSPAFRPASLRKKDQYGGIGSGRKLGNHLPRIASGDDEDEAELSTRKREVKVTQPAPTTPQPSISRNHRRYEGPTPMTPHSTSSTDSPTRGEFSVPAVTDAEAVAGRPDRIRLARRDMAAAHISPLPSSRLGRGLWADTQRHLIQAYEYLCHVGEAQQWIEGCLDEELGFGVVEMEEGLRNGVVLAKLARIWEGEGVVRKIFEHEKLQYRHSDNINVFLTFVRKVGLPESFIFELTDLYNKKNIPKVIYCLHALAHFLSRRGMANRIGNLLGRLEFSDDQLQQTQQGLNDAGVAMPNFGGVGRDLAKEFNEEPEEEPETEEERRDRLLLENESSITQLQAQCRGFLARRRMAAKIQKLQLRLRVFAAFQARCRGVLTRRQFAASQATRSQMHPWATKIQATARGIIQRRAWGVYLHQIDARESVFVKFQAHARGALERRRFKGLRGALRSSKFSVVGLQSILRAKISQRTHTEAIKVLHEPLIMSCAEQLQARARGVLVRRKLARVLHTLDNLDPITIRFQSLARAAIVRRQIRSQLRTLDDEEDVITRIQAACRAMLARRKLLALIRALRQAVPAITTFQAMARARLERQHHVAINRALSQAVVVTSVAGIQTFARAALARRRVVEQSRRLDFVMPDVVGFQSFCRGAIARDLYFAWRDHLHNSHWEATYLQALIRGAVERRKYRAKLEYYKANLSKVVKIQSLFRAKEQREQYRQLTMATNVTAGTIKNFVHLLDDSEADFEEEIRIERLRKRMVESIRETQALETEVTELDVKIALVVQNVKSFEELIKARRHRSDSAATHATKSSLLAAHGDPFSGSSSLDHATKHRLELYQQLFYLLQTKADYLARLFFHFTRSDVPPKTLRMTERVVLTIFGYGQDRREDFLLLHLLKMAIEEEIGTAPSIDKVAQSNPFYIGVIVHYVRPRQVSYVRDALQVIIQDMLEQEELDLETDPLLLYQACINEEEMHTGLQSHKKKDVPLKVAAADPPARLRFIRNLQQLQVLTDVFLRVIVGSTRKMPYGMRFVAHEMLNTLRARFPNQSAVTYATSIGHFIYHRYLHPAITNPETFDLYSGAVSPQAKKNLAAISTVLGQIASGVPFGADNVLSAINSYVIEAIPTFTDWFLEVAEVEDAEAHFQAHEFLDATVQPKPIYISPNEVYAMHSLLAQHINILAAPRDDPLRLILTELDGVPNLGSEELKDARDRAVELELTNRFADVRDPHANEKAIWVQAKRGVLAVLRVQPAADLVESLLQEVTDEHEYLWEEVVTKELVYTERQEQRHGRQASAAVADSAYRLEDIRTLSYADVKEHALLYLLELEKLGKVTRADGYQGILNAIAVDLRSKHRRRIQRRQEMDAMNDALKHLNERKAAYKDQIASYNNYVDSAMSTMQRGKGKTRFVMPFSKQFFHMRKLQKDGRTPQFGSYIYSAQELYDKGILLSIDRFSPRQFDRINLVLESNQIGVFTIKVTNNTINGITSEVATQELRMEDLLQANFEGKVSLSLFDGMAKVNLNLLLFQINKKFYV
ncbi:hypothetical protein DL93DRAFT_2107201 [Clavulina sp. PMI_390]|nr:hypothetical protein DL93DRAFT_2107201 [Clavulina sp. PMI_390]